MREEMTHTKYMENLTQLAATGTALDLAIAEAQGLVTVKKLRTRGPRKGETWRKGQTGGRPTPDGNRPVGAHVACNGGWAANGQVGIGAQKPARADAAKRTFDLVHAADRKAEARLRAAERRGEL